MLGICVSCSSGERAFGAWSRNIRGNLRLIASCLCQSQSEREKLSVPFARRTLLPFPVSSLHLLLIDRPGVRDE